MAALRNVHVDLALLGVHGMDPDSGFTSPNLNEAETDRALVASARRLVVVADHTKWGIVGLSTIAPLDQADVLVTDNRISAEARELLASRVRELIVAESPPRPRPTVVPDAPRADADG